MRFNRRGGTPGYQARQPVCRPESGRPRVGQDSRLRDYTIHGGRSGRCGPGCGKGALGSVDYASPEQALRQPLDGRTDLYAVGVILYELLLGQVPFQGGEPLETLKAHVEEPVPSLPSSSREILADLVESLLEKDPNRRPQTAIQVPAALDRIAGRMRTREPVGDPVAPPRNGMGFRWRTPGYGPSPGQGNPRKRRRASGWDSLVLLRWQLVWAGGCWEWNKEEREMMHLR